MTELSSMNPLHRRRFEALAGYTRNPHTAPLIEEVAWYESGNERLLGLVAVDLVDDDFSAAVLARDAFGRYRAIDVQVSHATEALALDWLSEAMARHVERPEVEYYQGDEAGKQIDFFTPMVSEAMLAAAFKRLTTTRGYTPAVGLLRELMHYFQDPDGNFVQQFQSTGFDARIWELYLYASFTELGYGFERSHPAPDFHCVGPLGDFFVEAATVNPTIGVDYATLQARADYYDAYVPIKFGSVLYSKLKKRYWDLTHVQGKPLVIAVQDFHAPGSMTWSLNGLIEHLYGVRQIAEPPGSGTIISVPIESHTFDGRTIETRFFAKDGAQHISAVIANPNGTLTKFNRMGFLAGFGDRDIQMIRTGYGYRGGSASPENFRAYVNHPNYEETWCEGMCVFHNPFAAAALPPDSVPGVAHYHLTNGQIYGHLPPFHPTASMTQVIVPTASEERHSEPTASKEPTNGE